MRFIDTLKAKLPQNYVMWLVLLPFGVDVIYKLPGKYFGGGSNVMILAGAYAAAVLLCAVLTAVLFNPINIRWDKVTAVKVLLLLQMALIVIFGYGHELGFYSMVMAVVLAVMILFPPGTEDIAAGAKVFVAAILVLLAVSAILLYLDPNFTVSVHPIRHSWADILPFTANRAKGLFSGPGMLGLVSAFVICYGVASNAKAKYIFVIVGFSGLLLSDSRASMLSVFACCALMILVILKQSNWNYKKLSDYAWPLSGFALSGLYFLTLGVQGIMSGSKSRFKAWEQAIVTATAPPNADVSHDYSHAHNFILAALNASSILVSIVLLAAAFLIIWIVWDAVRRRSMVSIAFMVPVIVYSSFEYGLNWNRLNIATTALLIGLAGSRFAQPSR